MARAKTEAEKLAEEQIAKDKAEKEAAAIGGTAPAGSASTEKPAGSASTEKPPEQGQQKQVEEEPDEMIQVSAKTLREIQQQMKQNEIDKENNRLRMAGLEQMIEDSKGPATDGQPRLREKKDNTPKFRTVRLHKMPMAGDVTNEGIVIGWSNRGAYQKIDKTGVAPVVVDHLDVFFLDHERNADGVLQAETVTLQSFLDSPTIICKIQKMDRTERKVPTGEEIQAMTYDEKHGMVSTGEIVDGFVGFTDTVYTIEVPGRTEPVEIDAMFVN
jgi:hypothetical protein